MDCSERKMYAVHRDIHPPTGIEQSIYCHFFRNEERNLVVAGTRILKVYKLRNDMSQPKAQEKVTDKVGKMKLECLASYELFGNLVSIQSVRLSGSHRDSLLLSFAEAKLSLVEYDPENHDLKTLSLHYFEDEDLKGGRCVQSYNLPTVRVDPEGRCAAILVYGSHLGILPFRRETVAEFTETTDGKPPVQSSYTIDLRTLNEKVVSVLDIQFLHGYNEPTLLILYEPHPTWAGRIAVRKDSCSLVALSLNIQERVHPIIWSTSGLPFDCLMTMPVPKPTGGVLVFAVNSLLYLNQSFPPYGVSLNSITDYSTEFPLRIQENVVMTLDCCQATFISYDKLVISLKGGELYVLTLLVDSMRAVRSFNLDKAAASVLTTTMTCCEDGYLFLGSRLGNSLLLKYTEKASGSAVDLPEKKDSTDEPAAKKQKKDDITDWMASDISAVDELDLEVYGKDPQKDVGSQISQFAFEVCDSIMNIGPCGQCVMGEPAFLSEEFSNSVDPDLELVTTSGYSKNGAISVLQRSIRPQVVTTFELPGCSDMWTVVANHKPLPTPVTEKALAATVKVVKTVELESSETGGEEKQTAETAAADGEEGGGGDGGGETKDTEKDKEKEKEKEKKEQPPIVNGHSFLILGRDDSTMVLQTGQEIMELDQSGFMTQHPTVYAGNIGENKYIVQVSKYSVRLMDGADQLDHMGLEVSSPVCNCSLADPYILLLMENGNVLALKLVEDPVTGAKLEALDIHIPQKSRILAVCAFRDVSAKFQVSTGIIETQPSVESPTKHTDPFLNMSNIDDEDDLLYGDSDITMTTPIKPTETAVQETVSTSVEKDSASPTYWAVLSWQHGNMEIFSLPDFTPVFSVVNFPMGHGVLMDTEIISQATSQATAGPEKMAPVDLPLVKEILLIGMGENQSRPYLMARVNDELVLYEVFEYRGSVGHGRLRLRFKKVNHGLIVKEKKPSRASRSKKAEIDREIQSQKIDRIKWLRPFNDISGYSGVFLCGPYPHWLIMTSRGILRMHPMSIDGSVTCFAPFHNVNCPKGFLYFNKRIEMRICVLPTHLSYDAPWPVRKVPLRCTPHYAVYHLESKTYSVVTSVTEVIKKQVDSIGDGQKEIKDTVRSERFVWPTFEKYGIQLFSPVSWEPIPNTRLELEEFEVVSCIKQVNLKSEGTLSGYKGFITVGSNPNLNEDITSRGRLIVYDVIDVVPEPGQPLTKNKMKIIYDKEQKGPVSALDHVDGHLVTAIGQKVYIWQLKDNDLQGLAFIDTQIYIHQISVVKNLILIADISKSILLLRFQSQFKVLSLVSRDIKPLEVYSVAYLVDNTTLTFLASDRLKNLIVYTYQPEVRESHGGQRLLRRADYHLGFQVNTFFRARCRLADPSSRKAAVGPIERRHVTYFATLDGSIGYLLPLTEKMYRRLLMVQSALSTQMAHIAGLNPRAFRTIKEEFPSLSTVHRNVLDSSLLWKYFSLPMSERIDLAKRIGTSNEQLVDDLMEIDRGAAHF